MQNEGNMKYTQEMYLSKSVTVGKRRKLKNLKL